MVLILMFLLVSGEVVLVFCIFVRCVIGVLYIVMVGGSVIVFCLLYRLRLEKLLMLNVFYCVDGLKVVVVVVLFCFIVFLWCSVWFFVLVLVVF